LAWRATAFTEIRRVLRPGAPFAGTDGIGRGIGFALLHIGDTKLPLRPDDLAQRLPDEVRASSYAFS
jgi:hypothetical protein